MYYFNMQQFIAENPDEKIQYDTLKFISSLQGLVNREEPVLYINLIEESDEFWLKQLRQDEQFLNDLSLVKLKSFDELVALFQDLIKGVVLWEEQVPATANLAATICGVEGYLPIRYDKDPNSLYTSLVLKGPQFKVGKDLVGMFTGKGLIPDSQRQSSGSKKCDAYLWAKEQYLDQGLCNPALMAYMLDGYTWGGEDEISYPDMDNSMLANHDYFIANKAFFFDLSPWDDESPNDDRNQPLGTDLATMKELLLAQYQQNDGQQITSIGGFTPWQVKYTTHNNDHCQHEGVATEWKYAEILSAYNAIMDADAFGLSGMANASIFSQHPLKDHYQQDIKLSERKLENKTYILYYMGDYDSAAWTSRRIPFIWDDSRRGEIPLMWPINPNLSERAPHVFHYLYNNKTENDYFAAGDSGAGYLNPTYLLEPRIHSELPGAIELWIKHNQYYYDKFDLSVTGFIINGHQPITREVMEAYTHFSPDGVGHNGAKADYVNDTAFLRHSADIAKEPGDLDKAAKIIYAKTEANERPFHIFRSILCSPTFMVELTEKIKKEHPENNYEVVDPYTFFALLKQYYKNK